MVIFDGESVDLYAMKIPGNVLLDQALTALEVWPEIADAAEDNVIPEEVLLAVGSRETNLSPYYVTHAGDNGHGHGLFQLDDRWHKIPDYFPVGVQAGIAAEMLAERRTQGFTWIETLNLYNSGSRKSEDTTGGDYGDDVAARAAYLSTNTGYGSRPIQGDLMPDSPAVQAIQEDLELTKWRLGQLLNMFQRQIELRGLKRPPDYQDWHKREAEWQAHEKDQP